MPKDIPNALGRSAFVVLSAPVLCAFALPQSALEPGGREAEMVEAFWHVLWIGAGVIWAAVLLIAAFAVLRRGRQSEGWGNVLIWGGGVIFPVAVLAALLPVSFVVLADIRIIDKRPAERVEVHGKLWWWEFVYDSDAYGRIVTANEFIVPVGVPVEISLHSDNVIHSFWVPALAGKMDLIPGRVNRMVVEATKPGVYRGQCAEFCGESHAYMAFDVRALPPEEYDAWLRDQAAPYRPPRPARRTT